MLEILLSENIFTSCLIVICSVLLVRWIFEHLRHENLPPGPRGLPIIGYAPFLGARPGETFAKLGETYGDIVRVRVLGRSMVCLNSYDAIRECFSTKGDEFSGRIQTTDDAFWFLTNGLGFIREEGPVWRDQRRFALHRLRDFGFGKLSLEDRVVQIGQDLVSALEAAKGQPYDPMNMLANATFNVILYLTTDKHFEESNPDFIMVRRNVTKFLGTTPGLTILLLGTLTKYLPNRWRPLFPAFTKIKEEFGDFINRIVKEHEANLEEDNPRDYVDAFLMERNKDLNSGKGQDTDFTEQRLVANVLNLLIAGTETTSNTLNWALRLLSSRPEIQERLHKELDEVVGRERLPSILDRPNLPYTDAVILEILRYTTIAATSVPHTNPAPAKLRGYDIPARSIILSNLWAVHNDPKLWPEPDKFDPDRFMNSETKAKKREYVIPFGIGKRSCLGESLARMELFLFLTMLLQKFTFGLTEGDKGEIREVVSTVRKLEPYHLHAYARE